MSDHDVESSSLYDITDSQQDVEDIKTFQPKNLQSLNGIECKDHDDQNREYLRLLESTPSSKPNQECETTKIICQSKTNQYDAQKQAAIDRYKVRTMRNQ